MREENTHVRRKTSERKENRVGNTRVSNFKDKRVRRETDKQASEECSLNFFLNQNLPMLFNRKLDKATLVYITRHVEAFAHLCHIVFSAIERFGIVFT